MPLPLTTETGRGKVSKLYGLDLNLDTDSDAVDASQDFNVAKARVGDVVEICLQDESTLVDLNAYVSALGVITVQIVNASGDTVTGNGIADLIVFHRN